MLALFRLLVVAVCGLFLSANVHAADWFVSPDGLETNAGTRESPWDISATLGGGQKIAPGDTIYLLPGTYYRRPVAEYEVRLVGTADAPITVRPADDGRVTIDGGLAVLDPSAYLVIRDLEILVSENFTMPREIDESGSHPESYGRPLGGLSVHAGSGSKFINLVIHDCAGGIACWIGARDVEMYGCLIYENGWLAPDRGHGHCIYTQNQEGTKTIRHCIMSAKYDGSYTMHAYGSDNAWVDNFDVRENIAFGMGPFLIGGGRPSRNIVAEGNVLCDVNMRIGYDAPHNENCEIRDNVIFGGSLDISNYQSAINEGNEVIPPGTSGPTTPIVRWFANEYDPDRAHLTVIAGTDAAVVSIPVGDFLQTGDHYRLLDPRDIYGDPIAEGECTSETIEVPMDGAYGVFVVMK